MSLLLIGVDYIAAMAVGLGMNVFGSRIFPHDKIKGDPRWVYYISIFSQMLIFPFFGFLGWRENLDIYRWCFEPWDRLPSVFWSRMYMASLWGYWMKDMYLISDPLIIVHHVFCLLSLLIAVLLRHVGGLGFIVLGTLVLELGTVFYNWRSLFPENRFCKYFYWLAIPASNLVALAMACWFWTFAEIDIVPRAFVFITVFGLVVGRQREMVLDVWHEQEKQQPRQQPQQQPQQQPEQKHK